MWLWNWFNKKEAPDKMKYLIIGLGNIGDEYIHTRHNIGFEVVEAIAIEKKANWKIEKLGAVSRVKHRGRTIVLLKPSTYMNKSGKAIQYWMQKEKIKIENILVIVDDLNLDFGKVRIRTKGSDGGHNGLKDINQLMGSSFARIRIGIGDQFKRGQQIDFVLGKWTSVEKKDLSSLIEHCANAALSYAAIGLAHTMNKFNK